MSDFDKEKEREKLREKYERDQQKREATEQMSELLLKGATMTNAHCSECGDPIFRYDGQEFCATCQKPVDRDAAEEAPEDGASSGNVEVTTPSDDATVVFGGEGQQTPGASTEDAADAEQAAEAQRSPQGTPVTDRAGPEDQSRAVPSLDPGSEVPEPAPSQAGEDVSAARDALVRTLTRFSRQAEAAENPQRARAHLQAAREAAETLAALRQ